MTDQKAESSDLGWWLGGGDLALLSARSANLVLLKRSQTREYRLFHVPSAQSEGGVVLTYHQGSPHLSEKNTAASPFVGASMIRMPARFPSFWVFTPAELQICGTSADRMISALICRRERRREADSHLDWHREMTLGLDR